MKKQTTALPTRARAEVTDDVSRHPAQSRETERSRPAEMMAHRELQTTTSNDGVPTARRLLRRALRRLHIGITDRDWTSVENSTSSIRIALEALDDGA